MEVITAFGYDWSRGRQDQSPHPFTQGFSIDDVRITTRFRPDYLSTALFGTMHEAGHALYEQGVDHCLGPHAAGRRALRWQCTNRSRACGKTWSAARCRSGNTSTHACSRSSPSSLATLSCMDFYRGINKVQPSLIRVEADEATYNLHIMLRLEIEIGLMEGSLRGQRPAGDLEQPHAGIPWCYPADDAQGVLQDVHWSSGLIGYFPTYALGNLISAQLWEKIQQDIPDLSDQIRRVNFEALLGWLREKVHCYGGKFEPQDLVQRVTGSKIDPAPYVRYLTRKYTDIYGLDL